MNLLIVTQKIDKDDENLGFFHRWVEEFAKSASKITIITATLGSYNLPNNVFVYSLGKEKDVGKIKRRWKYWELFSRHYARSDAVFFHMAPEFVIAAAPFLISLHRPSSLWYVHKSVTWRLRFAEKLVDYIFTASNFSFRLPSKKVIYTGHAIDTEFFKPAGEKIPSRGLRLLSLGRISPVKNYEIIINACAALRENWQRSWMLSIVGGPLMFRDKEYFASLKKLVKDKGLEDRIFFEGPRPYSEVPSIYYNHDIFISVSTTGSLDKAVLEAMASGLTVVVANDAYADILPAKYFIDHTGPEFLAERIKMLADEARPNAELRSIVVNFHSLEKTIRTIISRLQSV